MAKKYWKLEYLESFIGKEYINFEQSTHVRILSVRHSRFSYDTFDTQLDICSRPLHMPLTNESNGSMNVKFLSGKDNYKLKTPAIMVLYGQIKKEGQP